MNEKKLLLMLLTILGAIACQQNEKKQEPSNMSAYSSYPVYEGADLGIAYTSNHTTLKVWSPMAKAVKWSLYEKGRGGEAAESLLLEKGERGVWSKQLSGDYKGTYYTIQIETQEGWGEETPDPYAVALGVNGDRGCIIDLNDTNPNGWENDQAPALESPSQVVIYELHLRDLSVHPSSGIENKGKYLGLAESGTTSPQGLSTGLDHIQSLGVTHVHLLPVFDHNSIDEGNLEEGKFN